MTTIFICIDWFHPAYKAGGPVQSIANLVEQYGLGQVNFKIFCSDTDLDGTVNKGVPFDEWCNYNPYTQVWYASKQSRSVALMKREIKHSNADVLFIIGVYSWYFNIVPFLFGKSPVKIISARGMLHAGALSQKSFKKKIFLALWKMSGLQHRCFFHATDEQEKGFIRQVFGKKAVVFIAGNFPRVFALQPLPQKRAGELKMVSIAVISSMKNIVLVLEALQKCQRQIKYDIYGPVKDETYWRQCQAIIKMLPENISVSYKGDVVPTKIEETLKGYELFILPSKSENFGHAIYEALSAGKPVITSHHTPFNDLYNQHAGMNVTVENKNEMAKAIDFFAAMPPEEFEGWNKGARCFALKRIDMDKLKTQYDQMFSQKW